MCGAVHIITKNHLNKKKATFQFFLHHFMQYLFNKGLRECEVSIYFSDWHQSPFSPAQYLLMKAESHTIWTAHADNRAFSLTIGPSRCLALCWGNRAAHQHIGGSEEASDAPGHVPRPPSPHNLACSVPTQWQTHLRWQLWWTLNSSGDKCRDHSLLPTQVFNHDALLLLLTLQILNCMKSCSLYILRAKGVMDISKSVRVIPSCFLGRVQHGVLLGKHCVQK